MQSLLLILSVVGATLVQFHHHDECDHICLCLSPLDHCANHHPDHCDHQDSPDCNLHLEHSVIIDKCHDQLTSPRLPVAILDAWLLTLEAQPSTNTYNIYTDVGRSPSPCTDALHLRAPPV